MTVIFRSVPVDVPFTFESVGTEWEQPHVVRPEGYPYYHYLQTEKGCGRIETSVGSFVLHEDEGLLLAPHIRHSYEKESAVWYTKFASFTGTLESSIPGIVGSRSAIRIDREQGRKIAEMIGECAELCAASPYKKELLSVSCYRMLLEFAGGSHTHSLTDDPVYQNYVAPVIKEIEKRYAEPLTAAGLSSLVFITPQYLSRLFRKYMNCSTVEYLISFRISKAKELLITEPRTEIQAVAHRTGFTDASHFIATFRRITKITPAEFRRQN